MARPDTDAVSKINQSNFDVRDTELQKPIVFRASFNRFEHINLSQAWSLWVTGCQDDGVFGVTSAVGWFLTLSLISALILITIEHLSMLG
ncbi:hypothetical protein N836_35225 [Leptolyngbya sp. Heron Island J]|uniref:hypothetical protein n=1 Tax=Leptolyngbya sp. Heron Island J TaxID=1385935 RepID=UPI0003B942B7|nr:hypothetical protein [Leptolyngbya sp. Heron Island J]ESA37769.1 hypothetical protein N836_35225 [Leptolyngbya sp. Heron Island J]